MPPTISEKILDTLNSAVICLDSNACVSYINSTGEIMFGASMPALLGKGFEQLLSRVEINPIAESLKNYSRENQTITEHEAQITLANGHSFTGDYSIYTLDEITNDGQTVIEIKPMNRQLEIAQQTLSNQQKRVSQQFAQGVAHEIKNPLGGIRGAAQLLEKELDKADLKEFTDVIISEVDRLQVLIDNMWVRDTGIKMESVNILEILEHIRKLLQTAEPDKFYFYRDYDPSIPEIKADRGQLIQAFLNIALNALQAFDEVGEITFKTRIDRNITIGKIMHPLVVLIDIVDNGKGIASDISETIFLPMVTDKPEGSGLGLPIAQEIISRHGGIIKCKSSASGTVFSTILPLERV